MNSLGGPGNINIFLLSTSIREPGAVPCVFVNFVEFLGRSACLILVSGIISPRACHLFFINSTCASSNSSSIFRYSAITSRVISSSVGPSPPQVITTSQRLYKYANPAIISSSISETVTSCVSVLPELYNSEPSFARLVFTVSPNRISVPTDKRPIFITVG